MMKRWIRSRKRALQRKLRKVRPRTKLLGLCIVALLGIIGWQIMNSPEIPMTAYQPLLQTIAKGESSGNYNAYFGRNMTGRDITFTSMTVDQVIAWQKRYVAEGSRSSAVGRYQIIRSTLEGLKAELDLTGKERFDPTLQDRLAVTLLERRGVHDFVADELSQEQFAANLAKEWAALPRITGKNPNDSYYAGDGLNKARISTEEIFAALQPLKLL